MTGEVSVRERRSARLEARVDPELKRKLERAAALQGQTLSDFLVSSAGRAADEAIRAHGIMKLSEEDTHAFVQAFLSPEPPSPRLVAAAERYKAVLRNQ